MHSSINIFWFRRDLRLQDNAGLFHALQSRLPVLPIFIFDPYILDQLENKADRRVEFIHQSLERLQRELALSNTTIEIFYGRPNEIFAELISKHDVHAIFLNHDYEPYARERDELVRRQVESKNISFFSYKDQVIFERDEVVKDNKTPYTVFTPYSKRWRALLGEEYRLNLYPSEKLVTNFYKQSPKEVLSLQSIGFIPFGNDFPSINFDACRIRSYNENRDFPAQEGTSKLGIHLRFGTISIRNLVNLARETNDVFLNELIWREFYQMILWHFPALGLGKSFKSDYDSINWRNDENDFKAWCDGRTGFPFVDAGMRELNETGYMHNRARMVTASFLSKHLLIDWRWGEAYFAARLLDFEFASNNGGWQWAAGCGCDAAPYFRIFNPILQARKFDADEVYIRRWIAEYGTQDYPRPIVEHEFARKRAIETYKKGLQAQ